MTDPLGQYKVASGLFEAILPVLTRMASLLVLAIGISLATGQHWLTNMEEDNTGQFWPLINIDEEGRGNTGQYWPGSNIEEEARGYTGQYWPGSNIEEEGAGLQTGPWPVGPLGEEGADKEHEAEVGEPEMLEMLI